MVNRVAVIAAMRKASCWNVESESLYCLKEMIAAAHASCVFLANQRVVPVSSPHQTACWQLA